VVPLLDGDGTLCALVQGEEAHELGVSFSLRRR
jgi:hypothetical protein